MNGKSTQVLHTVLVAQPHNSYCMISCSFTPSRAAEVIKFSSEPFTTSYNAAESAVPAPTITNGSAATSKYSAVAGSTAKTLFGTASGKHTLT